MSGVVDVFATEETSHAIEGDLVNGRQASRRYNQTRQS